MSNLRDINQNLPIQEADIPDLGLLASRAGFDTQFDFSESGGGPNTVVSGQYVKKRNAAGQDQNIALTYTPNGKAWWEVNCRNGDLRKTNAAWQWCDLLIDCFPFPLVGPYAGGERLTMYNGAGGCRYHGGNLTQVFALEDGVTYTSRAYFMTESGVATFTHALDPGNLMMFGKAWGRS